MKDFRRVPVATKQGGEDVFSRTDQHQVERITILGSILVRGATGQLLQQAAELDFVFDKDKAFAAVEIVKVDPRACRLECRIDRYKSEAVGVTPGNQIDLHDLEWLRFR